MTTSEYGLRLLWQASNFLQQCSNGEPVSNPSSMYTTSVGYSSALDQSLHLTDGFSHAGEDGSRDNGVSNVELMHPL